MLLRVVSNINRAISSPDISIPSLSRSVETTSNSNKRLDRFLFTDFSPTAEQEEDMRIDEPDNDLDSVSDYNNGQYNMQDLIQENKYLRNELTMLCQRIIELEEVEKKIAQQQPPLSVKKSISSEGGGNKFEPQSPCSRDTSGEMINGKIGTAMLQIQKLEEELYRERLLVKELTRRLEVQEKSIIEKEDIITSLETVVDKLLSDLDLAQKTIKDHEHQLNEYKKDYECQNRYADALAAAQQKSASLEALLHEHQLELGNLVEGKQELHARVEELQDTIHTRDEQLLEVLNQLNEYEEAVQKLESIIHEANAKIMALDRKCDSQAKEIIRINSNKLENSSLYTPSIGPSIGPSLPPRYPSSHTLSSRPENLFIPPRPNSSSSLDSIGCSPMPLFPWMKES